MKRMGFSDSLRVVCFIFLSLTVNAQVFDKDQLEEIAKEQEILAEMKEKRVEDYLLNNQESNRTILLGDGRTAVLVDVIDGLPQYMATHNLQARRTTGVEYVQGSDGLNLPLNGQGITIGVWDGGLVLNSHVEFENNRVLNKLGSEYSTHATHVSGTIVAKGINPDARGMLPEANIISYYAFENDLGPMAQEAANGLILSNHSYGLVLGWNYNQNSGNWEWTGGDSQVDERFGSYTSNSRSIDEIAYNAPYYTIVWSAGNDRSDVGNGSRPADGPYDCIGPSAVAKNIITVGAITGFDSYDGLESIEMSGFSSWGPTNDGRIKPDIVGDGVGVLSASAAGDNAYATLQGTSMSAPNVTGSLGLIQQFHLEEFGNYMKSSSLKALMIHTAREAGQSPGPDYRFGWGVLNVVDALDVLNGLNETDTTLVNRVLNNSEEHVYELFSDGKTPLVATIAWTDVSGTPVAIGENDIMLKNDLDITIHDDEGNIVNPWVLNPSNPSGAATRGDNFRDNVEQIEIPLPSHRKYYLTVKHKGDLINGAQEYSLIFTGNDIRQEQLGERYWVAGNGNFEDSNIWSTQSGGEPMDQSDLENTSLIFDNNSLLNGGDVVRLNQSLSIYNLIWLRKESAIIDLGGNTLEINGRILIDSDSLIIRNGSIVYNSNTKRVELQFDGLEDLTLSLSSNDSVIIDTDISIDSLVLSSGNYFVESRLITVNNVMATAESKIRLIDNDITINGGFFYDGYNWESEGNSWQLLSSSIDFGNIVGIFNDSLNIMGVTHFNGQFDLDMTVNNAEVVFSGNSSVGWLKLNGGSVTSISDTLLVKDTLILSSELSNEVIIEGNDNINKAVLKLGKRKKYCFDNLDISNLVVLSSGVFNAGFNSSVLNSENIIQANCEDVIFADFDISGSCANSIITFKDYSSGTINEYLWDFGNGITYIQEPGSETPVTSYTEPGSYVVELTVRNDGVEDVFRQEIEISDNTLSNITIVENEQGLVSSIPGEMFIWYRNGLIIEGENGRILSNPLESGIYQVAYSNGTSANGEGCSNRISEPYEILVTANKSVWQDNLIVYPNPSKGSILIEGLEKEDDLMIFNAVGEIIFKRRLTDEHINNVISSGISLHSGLNIVLVKRNNEVYTIKVINEN